MIQAEHLLPVSCELGEGPLWHPIEAALYWTDILNNRIYRYHPATEKQERFELPLPVGSFAFRKDGGFVLAAKDRFAFWRPGSELETIVQFDDLAGNDRFNDGEVDSRGRYWAGPVSKSGSGRLYCLDVDGSVTVKEYGITTSNGIGWSPDKTKMYYTDTATQAISVYDYEAETGQISKRRPFVSVPETMGRPDGLAVDVEGGVWSAMWGGWQVVRFTPDGQVDRRIQTQAERTSSCTFGGENLDVLYITTAKEGMRPQERTGQPLAGDLFKVSAGVRGLPVNFFG